MTTAYQYSYVRLVLNYYTLFESIAEETHVSDHISGCSTRLNELLTDYYSGKDVLEGVLALREDITSKVEIMTSYADCFQIFEYVLNRMERKFKTMPVSPFHDDAFAKRLMEYITGSSETSVMNGRIKEVIGQLPVRLTKQKFFSLVMEGLSVYIGSPMESLKDMMYTLRTESMTQLPKDMDHGYQDFYKLLEQLRRVDYKNMTAEGYEDAIGKLGSVSEGLTKESGFYVMIQEIVNDFCVLILSGGEAVVDVKEEELYSSAVKEILHNFAIEEDSFGSDEIFLKLTQMEGRQEAFYEKYLRIELPQVSEGRNFDPDDIKSMNVDILLSGSSFAKLKCLSSKEESEKKEEEVLVDRLTLEKEAGAYLKELEDVFAGSSKQVVRAIMAKVLSDLPVYFGSIDEIQSYITGSLNSCQDEAEKETCKELLEELMDYENKLV
jgi:hypothetical protein